MIIREGVIVPDRRRIGLVNVVSTYVNKYCVGWEEGEGGQYGEGGLKWGS
jgi:hypothetical protein